MSFSQTVKKELADVRLRHDEDRLLLISGYTLAIASLKYVKSGGWGLRYVSECAPAVRFIAKLISQAYDIDQQISVTVHQRLHAKNTELTVFGRELEKLMLDTGFATLEPDGTRSFTRRLPEGLENDHACRAFIRGVFLACGSVSDPAKGCHAELVIKDELLARTILKLLADKGVSGKLTIRKSTWVVYFKEGEKVEDFLTFMGAGEAMLAVSEQRMLREIANNSNREVNCFSANMEKAARASAAQVEDIRLILTEKGTDCLTDELYEVASARMANPDMTLSQLAELLEIGKSAVNYRLRKLAEIAKCIKLELGIYTEY